MVLRFAENHLIDFFLEARAHLVSGQGWLGGLGSGRRSLAHSNYIVLGLDLLSSDHFRLLGRLRRCLLWLRLWPLLTQIIEVNLFSLHVPLDQPRLLLRLISNALQNMLLALLNLKQVVGVVDGLVETVGFSLRIFRRPSRIEAEHLEEG